MKRAVAVTACYISSISEQQFLAVNNCIKQQIHRKDAGASREEALKPQSRVSPQLGCCSAHRGPFQEDGHSPRGPTSTPTGQPRSLCPTLKADQFILGVFFQTEDPTSQETPESQASQCGRLLCLPVPSPKDSLTSLWDKKVWGRVANTYQASNIFYWKFLNNFSSSLSSYYQLPTLSPQF